MNSIAENPSKLPTRNVEASWRGEKRPINLVTTRATAAERDRLKALVKKYGLAGPSHFFRTCLDKFFEADDAGNLKLPIDLARTGEPESNSVKQKPAQNLEGSKRQSKKKAKS